MDFPDDAPEWGDIDEMEEMMDIPDDYDNQFDEMMKDAEDQQSTMVKSSNNSGGDVRGENEVGMPLPPSEGDHNNSNNNSIDSNNNTGNNTSNNSNPYDTSLLSTSMNGGDKVVSTSSTMSHIPPHLLRKSKMNDLELYSFKRMNKRAGGGTDEYRTFKTLSNTGATSEDHKRLLRKRDEAMKR